MTLLVIPLYLENPMLLKIVARYKLVLISIP